jgi:hypothetical protein
MEVLPGVNAMTLPLSSTVATLGFELSQSTELTMLIGLPTESTALAVNAPDCRGCSVIDFGASETFATWEASTSATAVALLVPATAVTTTSPDFFPVTTPPADTRATEASELVNETGTPVTGLPLTSRTTDAN